MKLQVKDLKKGDKLSSCEVIETPFVGDTKMIAVHVRFKGGKECLRHWGKYTTVTINNR